MPAALRQQTLSTCSASTTQPGKDQRNAKLGAGSHKRLVHAAAAHDHCVKRIGEDVRRAKILRFDRTIEQNWPFPRRNQRRHQLRNKLGIVEIADISGDHRDEV